MTDRDSPVTMDELHAYVDGVLPPDRRQAVEAWLATHPEDAARVAEWRALADAVRSRYAGVAEEPVPARFDLARLSRSGRPWRAVAAAAVVAAIIGGAAGWIAHGASAAAPTIQEVLTAEALAAHRLYINEVRHPVEVRANETHLVPWLSKRVGATICARPIWKPIRSSSSAGGCCRARSGRRRCSCTRGRPASASPSIARSRRCCARRCATRSAARSRRCTGSRARSAYVVSRPRRPRAAREDRADRLRADGEPADARHRRSR